MGIKRCLVGKRFGRLTVVCDSEARKHGEIVWECMCDCGNKSFVRRGNLIDGRTKSCGCLRVEQINKHRRSTITHGDSKMRLYSIWKSMIRRCTNKKDKNYKTYGNKGIIVFQEWREYSCFKEWALYHGYNEHLSIDRIDNNKGYSPDNCRWITPKQQTRNRNITKKYNGIPIAEECERMGIKYTTVKARINRLGWPIEKALFTPVQKSEQLSPRI